MIALLAMRHDQDWGGLAVIAVVFLVVMAIDLEARR